MRTPPYRRDDGKFGVEDDKTPEITPGSPTPLRGRGPGRRFKSGAQATPGPGRPPGRRNRTDVDLEELRKQAPASSAGIQDELVFLRWVWQTETHRLDLRLKAAAEAAQYKYKKLTHNTHDISEELKEMDARLRRGRERVAEAAKKKKEQ